MSETQQTADEPVPTLADFIDASADTSVDPPLAAELLGDLMTTAVELGEQRRALEKQKRDSELRRIVTPGRQQQERVHQFVKSRGWDVAAVRSVAVGRVQADAAAMKAVQA